MIMSSETAHAANIFTKIFPNFFWIFHHSSAFQYTPNIIFQQRYLFAEFLGKLQTSTHTYIFTLVLLPQRRKIFWLEKCV
jgi:hypothetical protein